MVYVPREEQERKDTNVIYLYKDGCLEKRMIDLKEQVPRLPVGGMDFLYASQSGAVCNFSGEL